jgi:hypothetical protein
MVGRNAEGSGAGLTPALRGRLPPTRDLRAVSRPRAEGDPGSAASFDGPGTSPNRCHRHNPSGLSIGLKATAAAVESNRSSCRKIEVTAMCAPWALSKAGPGFRSRRAGTEVTGSPPGTDQGSDDVTECHTLGEYFGGLVARWDRTRGQEMHCAARFVALGIGDTCTSPRRPTRAEVPAGAVYTGGHPLEIGPESLTLSHFSACPAWISDDKSRFTSRFIRSRSDCVCDLPEQAEHHVGRGTRKSHIDFR